MARVVATLLSYPPARHIGSELMSHRLLVALHQRGHEVTVLTNEDHGEWDLDGIHVRPQRSWRRRQFRPDLVVAHADFAINARAMQRRWADLPVALLCHNLEGQVWNGLCVTNYALAVANAQWAVDALRAKRVDPLLVRPPLAVTPRREPYRGRRFTIVNFNENKGGHLAWTLAERLPQVPFLFVRGGYGKQVEHDPLPNVKTLAHVPHGDMPSQVWARSRALLVPSERETWGSTASEALAHGVPVVASPTPGLVENLAEAGLYADRDDVAAWMQAIGVLRDDDYRASRASEALHRARFLAEQSAADLTAWCDAVERVLEGRHGAAAAG